MQQLAISRKHLREEYIGLLDYYISPSLKGFPEPEPTLLALPRLENKDSRASRDPAPILNCLTAEREAQISKAKTAIKDRGIQLEELFDIYKALPNPGVQWLSFHHRSWLLRRFAVVEKKSWRQTAKYLSILDDMKLADLNIPEWAWNSAIHMAGRTMTKITAGEVEDALRIWKEMEQDAGILGSSVTFNILFDIAVKACRFSLAEMILQEMNQRQLEMTRFTRAGLIYYKGLRRDGDGIRKAYLKLVEEGEIVDTMVLNCVIASFLRAGEPAAATQVYERMKVLHSRLGGPPPPHLDWSAARGLGRLLQKSALRPRSRLNYLEKKRNQHSLAPDTRTYIILINHHATQSGQLSSIVRLIEEMQVYGLPVEGRIFQEMFKGFAKHGRVRYTAWTTDRLNSVWHTFNKLSDDEEIKNVYMAKWSVIWALKAYARCYGRRTTLQIWEDLKLRWERTAEEEKLVSGMLERYLRYIERLQLIPP